MATEARAVDFNWLARTTNLQALQFRSHRFADFVRQDEAGHAGRVHCHQENGIYAKLFA